MCDQGANAFMVKSYNIAQLTQAVRALLDS